MDYQKLELNYKTSWKTKINFTLFRIHEMAADPLDKFEYMQLKSKWNSMLM